MMKASGLILSPLSALYSAAVRTRLALYQKGALRTHRITSPVISVGNITTGGTGKTPIVAWIARALARDGLRVCILTRGYGRDDAGERVVVSDGQHLSADAAKGGDEPRLLAERLQGIASVISDANRVAAAEWAEENLKADIFILDDGFQHVRIARDLDVVAIDSTRPWGGGRLLPRGRLREPLNGLRRADLLILTRAEQCQDIESLRKHAERLSDGRPILVARTSTSAVLSLALEPSGPAPNDPGRIAGSPVSQLTSGSVGAFCAVGNPDAFFDHLRNDGYVLAFTYSFGDHHRYTQNDIDLLGSEAARQGAGALFTTAKDAVKLGSFRFDVPCYVLEIELEFEDEEKLVSMLREAVERKRPSRAIGT